MRKIIFLFTAYLALATSAQAANFECHIDNYGRPVNFAGAFQHQKELMRSWLPAETFFLYINEQDVILHHSGGEDGRTPASNISSRGDLITYRFRDEPRSSGNSIVIRDTTLAFDQSDFSFSIVMRKNNGARTKQSGGSAFGQCTQTS